VHVLRLRLHEDPGLAALAGCRRATVDRERPQARRRPARSLLPTGAHDSHRAHGLLPHARRALRDQRGERVDPTGRDGGRRAARARVPGGAPALIDRFVGPRKGLREKLAAYNRVDKYAIRDPRCEAAWRSDATTTHWSADR